MAAPAGVSVLWIGTHAGIPSGWSRVTAYDGLYLKGAAAGVVTGAGLGTGGATTHTGHTVDAHTHTQNHAHNAANTGGPNATQNANSSSPDNTGTTSAHTHGGSGTINSVSQSTNAANTTSFGSGSTGEPAHREYILIESDGTGDYEPNMVGFINGAAPSGWTTTTASFQHVKIAATSGNGGATGSAVSHNHSYSHNHTSQSHNHGTSGGIQGTSGNSSQFTAGGNLVANASHWHDLGSTSSNQDHDANTSSATSGSTTVQPPYVNLRPITPNSTLDTVPSGFIGMWTGDIASLPGGWERYATGNERYLRAATSSLGSTGGSANHQHFGASHSHSQQTNSHSITTQQPSSTTTTIGASTPSVTVATSTHTHTMSVSSSTTSGSTSVSTSSAADGEPPHRTIFYIELTVIPEFPEATDSATLNTTETHSTLESAIEVDTAAANTTEDYLLREGDVHLEVDNAAVNTTESVTVQVGEYFEASDTATFNTTESAVVREFAASVDDATINTTETYSGVDQAFATDTAGINSSEDSSVVVFGDFAPRGLRVDIYDVDGVKLATGPLTGILSAEYSQGLDRIGTFRLTLGATNRKASVLEQSQRLWLYREGEGLVFKGIVDKVEESNDASGQAVLSVSGQSIARDLIHANSLLGRKLEEANVTTWLTDLLTSTGWDVGDVDNALNVLTLQIDGKSIWESIVHCANTIRAHAREDLINESIDVGQFGDDSGIRFENYPAGAFNNSTMRTFPIATISSVVSAENVWNRVIPLGSGEGVNRFSLQWSTRVAPYTILDSVGPDGEPYYYIEDATSIAAHRARTIPLKFDDISPLENDNASFTLAANTLYDAAVDWLQKHKDAIEEHDITTVGLRQYEGVTATPKFKLGQKAHIRYNGYVEDNEGAFKWKTVDDDYFIMGFDRRFNSDGSDDWKVHLNSTDALVEGDTDFIANAINGIKTIQLSNKPYTYREIHGPQRQAVDSSNSLLFKFNFDDDVAYLHRAKLEIRIRGLRANASGAASGGGDTVSSSSGGGSSPTTSSGGGSTPTSSSGGSHTHAVSAESTGNGIGVIGTMRAAKGGDGGDTTGAGSSHAHATHAHIENLAGSYVQNATTDFSSVGSESTHTHPLTEYVNAMISYDHWHDISGQAALASTDHTHSVTIAAHTHSVTVPSHSHNVTIDSHTHAVTFGITQQTTPASMSVNVSINGTNRTVALGGPWNSDALLDVTEYLVDGDGKLLRQDHEFLFSVAQLGDLEVSLRSLVTALSLAPA
jgi:hypothetical protein